MRNIDKIADLETKLVDARYENGRLEKKVSDQQKELSILTTAREETSAGVSELNRLAEALCIQCINTFGKDIGDGITELRIPKYDAVALTGKYEVRTRWSFKSDEYILCAARRPQEAEIKA